MTEALAAPHIAHGVGWTALIYASHIDVRVDPTRDVIAEVVRVLLEPDQRRFWTVEAIESDTQGRDLYHMEREAIVW